MTSPIEFLQAPIEHLAALLRRLGTRFHLSGDIARLAWGEPRSIHVVEVVLDGDELRPHLEAFLQGLRGAGFVFQDRMVAEAVDDSEMFALLDPVHCLKLNIHTHSQVLGEFQRSVTVEVFAGQMLPVASRVDVMVLNLVRAGKGCRESRHELGRLLDQMTANEFEILWEQARMNRLTDLLEEVLEESDPISM